ncbi:hypothetical protein SBOR_9610 [Sclerotinia borealis F-4128]|uniref:Aromatic amino acid beta-eliminating lyase/threonine aldolase domain-containing protein n=1 Tax=Sclerotinia borealis (strain F-4128) TaxID=1432307 RepID=W9BZK2_SCLBF|nr:hypothetical protein SBOR_9610 [Sclerotinia borealis F-4128]
MGAAWQSPGPATYDFRTGVNDGWNASGASGFEAEMGRLTGRDATLFMVFSIMGNQVALRTHLGTPPHSILCDVRSHLVHMETGGAGSWSGALMVTIASSNGLWLTLKYLQRYAVISDGTDFCTCPIKLIHLEVPLGGIVMPLSEVKRICHWARSNDIVVHLDGARLWEAVASVAGTLHEYCALPDSINLCLTEGLGGEVDSALVGNKAYLKRAKWVKKTNSAQYYSMVQYVSSDRSGVLLTKDPGKEMLERYPQLMNRDNVAVSWSPKCKGDKVLGLETMEVAWLSRYIVTSRQSLSHLLDLGAEIRR